VRAAFHFCEHVAARVLERDVEILCEALVRGDCFKQARRDTVRVAVEEAYPVQILDLREALGEAAAGRRGGRGPRRSRLCPGRSAKSHARRQRRGFRPRAPPTRNDGCGFAAQSRDYAEGTGVVATLVDLDVCGVARRGENARREVVIKIGRCFTSAVIGS